MNGVPGTLGGALIMNAGAWGGEISENLIHVELINSKNEIKNILKKDLNFSYRKSSFQKDDILLSAKFDLKKADENIIHENFVKAQSGRRNTQPLNQRSAGSLFKNPENNSAGQRLDEAGLKGFSIGDAMISDHHANFFVNKKNASFDDMNKLITYVKDQVKEKYNINLELEVEIIN